MSTLSSGLGCTSGINITNQLIQLLRARWVGAVTVSCHGVGMVVSTVMVLQWAEGGAAVM